MRKLPNNTSAFFELLRAGLWEQDVKLSVFEPIDFNDIYRLAHEQSVVGLITAGLEHVVDIIIPKEVLLTFVGETLQIEQRNTEMNDFIKVIFERLQTEGINATLVKGQGIAQCYERPLWRSSGDIDILLNQADYYLAKNLLISEANLVEKEDPIILHQGMVISSWEIELHGTLHANLWDSIDDFLDSIQYNIITKQNIRIRKNTGTNISLPSTNNEALYIFIHILQHFLRGGIGIRQLCDWRRLLWVYRDSVDAAFLEDRLKQAKLIIEWKAFASFAVNYLGINEASIPLFDPSKKWNRMAQQIATRIIKLGNFGQNRDLVYQKDSRLLVRKTITYWRNSLDSFRLLFLFPVDAFRVWRRMSLDGIKSLY